MAEQASNDTWPDHEYLPYLKAEQALYAWVLSKVAGVNPEEAMNRAILRFHYEPPEERGGITHFGAWRIAMADLFGDPHHRPEEFGLAEQLDEQVRRLFHGDL
jgi:hypothetical protein